ncbi:hypothetical protein JYT82_00370 [bacterium AH-315-K20]|nr:hypothetical protein [bacterium AH-315-K20]
MHTIPTSPKSTGYSATVRLTLRIGDRRFELAQVGPTWVLFDKPVVLPSGSAVLEIEIDGRYSLTEIEFEETEMPSSRYSYFLMP